MEPPPPPASQACHLRLPGYHSRRSLRLHGQSRGQDTGSRCSGAGIRRDGRLHERSSVDAGIAHDALHRAIPESPRSCAQWLPGKRPESDVARDSRGFTGFTPAGFISAFVLSDRFNFAQGFDHLRPVLRPGDFGEPNRIRAAIRGVNNRCRDPVSGRCRRLGALVPVRALLRSAPAVLRRPVASSRCTTRARREPLPGLADLAKPSAGNGSARQASLERYAQRYASEIAYMDREVGRLGHLPA